MVSTARMSSSSSSESATKLKLRALELKKAGDLDGARALLARAREVEFESVTADEVDNLSDPAALKRLAVVLKGRGDIAGAKEALLKAKRLEAEAAAAGGGGAAAAASAATPEAESRQQPQHPRRRKPTPAQQLSARIPCLYNTSTKAVADTGEGGEHRPERQEQAHDAHGKDAASKGKDDDENNGNVTFTDEEMADVETMCDMKTMGMDVPTESDYAARIQARKLAALAAKKKGDIGAAKRELHASKQLEAAMAKLHSDDGGEDDDDSDDGEDYSLLDELNDDGAGGNDEDDAFLTEMFYDDGNSLDLDDLDHIDAFMLKDMMEAGMDVPDVDDILRSAQEKKELAIALHKDGNTVAAKAALAENKRLQGRAEMLAGMLEEIESGALDGGDDMEALEAMLAASEGGGGAASVKAAKKTEPSTPAEPMKSSEEYKVDAVRNKREGNLAEAAAALQMYKKALAAESSAAETKRREEIISELRDEIALSKEQERLFAYYERFVDKKVGAAQLSFWKRYGRDCARAARAVEAKGSNAVDIARSAKGGAITIRGEDDLGFVGRCIDPTDEPLEVAILEVSGLLQNKHLKKALRQREKDPKQKGTAALWSSSIRVDVTIQLPPNEKEAEENIVLTYVPTICSEDDGGYEFGPSQSAIIPRGSSRHAKTILRRMGRKRIQITVFYVPPKAKKGLFGRSNSETFKSETSLGTVVLELKDLLGSNLIAGDYPLMDSTRRNELGGIVRLGVRTGKPYDPEEGEGMALGHMSKVDMKPYESMSFLSSSSGTGF